MQRTADGDFPPKLGRVLPSLVLTPFPFFLFSFYFLTFLKIQLRSV